MNFLKKLPILVAFYSKIHTYSCSKKNSFFFGKPLYFYITAKNSNVFRNLTVSVALYSKIATSSHFRKINFFLKNPPFFSEQLKFFEFFEKYDESSCILQQTCQHQQFLKTSRFFLGKRIVFCKKTQLLKVLRTLTVPFAFDIQLANFNCFQRIQVFFSKNHLFFRFQIWTFWEILLIQSMLRQVCYLQPFNKNSRFFYENLSFFFKKKTNFERV